MRVLCILQARVGSSRLPGKVLLPILGEPMLARQIERIRRARRIDLLIVATSDQPDDDAVAELCRRLGVPCYRGSLDDVLDRFHGAAAIYRPLHVLRLTGDCPLTDPALLDRLITQHLESGADITSNAHIRTFPDGLDAEIFTFALLDRAWRDARSAYDREHVTPFMYRRNVAWRPGVLRDATDRSHMRWTVDRAEDFEFVTRVFEALYPGDPAFSSNDVHHLLAEHPDIARINAGLAVKGAQ